MKDYEGCWRNARGAFLSKGAIHLEYAHHS